MSDPKKERKKLYKVETPREAKELYIWYVEGIIYEEIKDGLGLNIDY